MASLDKGDTAASDAKTPPTQGASSDLLGPPPGPSDELAAIAAEFDPLAGLGSSLTSDLSSSVQDESQQQPQVPGSAPELNLLPDQGGIQKQPLHTGLDSPTTSNASPALSTLSSTLSPDQEDFQTTSTTANTPSLLLTAADSNLAVDELMKVGVIPDSADAELAATAPPRSPIPSSPEDDSPASGPAPFVPPSTPDELVAIFRGPWKDALDAHVEAALAVAQTDDTAEVFRDSIRGAINSLWTPTHVNERVEGHCADGSFVIGKASAPSFKWNTQALNDTKAQVKGYEAYLVGTASDAAFKAAYAATELTVVTHRLLALANKVLAHGPRTFRTSAFAATNTGGAVDLMDSDEHMPVSITPDLASAFSPVVPGGTSSSAVINLPVLHRAMFDELLEALHKCPVRPPLPDVPPTHGVDALVDQDGEAAAAAAWSGAITLRQLLMHMATSLTSSDPDSTGYLLNRIMHGASTRWDMANPDVLPVTDAGAAADPYSGLGTAAPGSPPVSPTAGSSTRHAIPTRAGALSGSAAVPPPPPASPNRQTVGWIASVLTVEPNRVPSYMTALFDGLSPDAPLPLPEQDYVALLGAVPWDSMWIALSEDGSRARPLIIDPVRAALRVIPLSGAPKLTRALAELAVAASSSVLDLHSDKVIVDTVATLTRSPWPAKAITISTLDVVPWKRASPTTLEAVYRELAQTYSSGGSLQDLAKQSLEQRTSRLREYVQSLHDAAPFALAADSSPYAVLSVLGAVAAGSVHQAAHVTDLFVADMFHLAFVAGSQLAVAECARDALTTAAAAAPSRVVDSILVNLARHMSNVQLRAFSEWVQAPAALALPEAVPRVAGVSALIYVATGIVCPPVDEKTEDDAELAPWLAALAPAHPTDTAPYGGTFLVDSLVGAVYKKLLWAEGSPMVRAMGILGLTGAVNRGITLATAVSVLRSESGSSLTGGDFHPELALGFVAGDSRLIGRSMAMHGGRSGSAVERMTTYEPEIFRAAAQLQVAAQVVAHEGPRGEYTPDWVFGTVYPVLFPLALSNPTMQGLAVDLWCRMAGLAVRLGDDGARFYRTLSTNLDSLAASLTDDNFALLRSRMTQGLGQTGPGHEQRVRFWLAILAVPDLLTKPVHAALFDSLAHGLWLEDVAVYFHGGAFVDAVLPPSLGKMTKKAVLALALGQRPFLAYAAALCALTGKERLSAFSDIALKCPAGLDLVFWHGYFLSASAGNTTIPSPSRAMREAWSSRAVDPSIPFSLHSLYEEGFPSGDAFGASGMFTTNNMGGYSPRMDVLAAIAGSAPPPWDLSEAMFTQDSPEMTPDLQERARRISAGDDPGGARARVRTWASPPEGILLGADAVEPGMVLEQLASTAASMLTLNQLGFPGPSEVDTIQRDSAPMTYLGGLLIAFARAGRNFAALDLEFLEGYSHLYLPKTETVECSADCGAGCAGPARMQVEVGVQALDTTANERLTANRTAMANRVFSLHRLAAALGAGAFVLWEGSALAGLKVPGRVVEHDRWLPEYGSGPGDSLEERPVYSLLFALLTWAQRNVVPAGLSTLGHQVQVLVEQGARRTLAPHKGRQEDLLQRLVSYTSPDPVVVGGPVPDKDLPETLLPIDRSWIFRLFNSEAVLESEGGAQAWLTLLGIVLAGSERLSEAEMAVLAESFDAARFFSKLDSLSAAEKNELLGPHATLPHQVTLCAGMIPLFPLGCALVSGIMDVAPWMLGQLLNDVLANETAARTGQWHRLFMSASFEGVTVQQTRELCQSLCRDYMTAPTIAVMGQVFVQSKEVQETIAAELADPSAHTASLRTGPGILPEFFAMMDTIVRHGPVDDVLVEAMTALAMMPIDVVWEVYESTLVPWLALVGDKLKAAVFEAMGPGGGLKWSEARFHVRNGLPGLKTLHELLDAQAEFVSVVVEALNWKVWVQDVGSASSRHLYQWFQLWVEAWLIRHGHDEAVVESGASTERRRLPEVLGPAVVQWHNTDAGPFLEAFDGSWLRGLGMDVALQNRWSGEALVTVARWLGDIARLQGLPRVSSAAAEEVLQLAVICVSGGEAQFWALESTVATKLWVEGLTLAIMSIPRFEVPECGRNELTAALEDALAMLENTPEGCSVPVYQPLRVPSMSACPWHSGNGRADVIDLVRSTMERRIVESANARLGLEVFASSAPVTGQLSEAAVRTYLHYTAAQTASERIGRLTVEAQRRNAGKAFGSGAILSGWLAIRCGIASGQDMSEALIDALKSQVGVTMWFDTIPFWVEVLDWIETNWESPRRSDVVSAFENRLAKDWADAHTHAWKLAAGACMVYLKKVSEAQGGSGMTRQRSGLVRMLSATFSPSAARGGEFDTLDASGALALLSQQDSPRGARGMAADGSGAGYLSLADTQSPFLDALQSMLGPLFRTRQLLYLMVHELAPIAPHLHRLVDDEESRIVGAEELPGEPYIVPESSITESPEVIDTPVSVEEDKPVLVEPVAEVPAAPAAARIVSFDESFAPEAGFVAVALPGEEQAQPSPQPVEPVELGEEPSRDLFEFDVSGALVESGPPAVPSALESAPPVPTDELEDSEEVRRKASKAQRKAAASLAI